MQPWNGIRLFSRLLLTPAKLGAKNSRLFHIYFIMLPNFTPLFTIYYSCATKHYLKKW